MKSDEGAGDCRILIEKSSCARHAMRPAVPLITCARLPASRRPSFYPADARMPLVHLDLSAEAVGHTGSVLRNERQRRAPNLPSCGCT
jgi:hypothetical protein